MLNRAILEACINPSISLTTAQRTFSVVGDMSNVVNFSTFDNQPLPHIEIKNNDDKELAVNLITDYTSGEDHEIQLADLVRTKVLEIQQTLDIMRNTIIPEIKELSTEIVKGIEFFVANTRLPEVHAKQLPGIITNNIINVDALQDFDELFMVSQGTGVYFEFDKSTLNMFLQSESELINSAVRSLLNDLSDEVDLTFGIIHMVMNNPENYWQIVKEISLDIVSTVAIHALFRIIAVTMKTKMPDVDGGFTRDQWTNLADQLVLVSGQGVSRSVANYRVAVKNDTVVIGVNMDDSIVYVINDTYNEMVADNSGVVDIIKGFAYGRIKVANKQYIADNASELMQVQSNMSYQAQQLQFTEQNKATQLVVLKWLGSRDLTEIEAQVYGEKGCPELADKDVILNGVDYHQQAVLISSQVVNRLLFPFINGEHFVNSYLMSEKTNTDYSDENHLMEAMIDIAAQHVADQFLVEDISMVG